MLLEQLMDMRNLVTRTAYTRADAYDAALASAATTGFPSHLKGFEAFIKGDWLLGDDLSVADVVLYELADQIGLMVPGILEGYPKVAALLTRFEALPKIAEYRASPRYLRRPINNVMASFL